MTTPVSAPPSECPACGCTEIEFFIDGDELIFRCNASYYFSTDGKWYMEKSREHRCTRAMDVAISLRSTVAALTARAEKAEAKSIWLYRRLYNDCLGVVYAAKRTLDYLYEFKNHRALAESQTVSDVSRVAWGILNDGMIKDLPVVPDEDDIHKMSGRLAYAERDKRKAEAERDALAAELAQARAQVAAGEAVRKDQMELDCKAMCRWCEKGYPVDETMITGARWHRISGRIRKCYAAPIRSTNAALAAAPTPVSDIPVPQMTSKAGDIINEYAQQITRRILELTNFAQQWPIVANGLHKAKRGGLDDAPTPAQGEKR